MRFRQILSLMTLAGVTALAGCGESDHEIHNPTVRQAFDMQPKQPEVELSALANAPRAVAEVRDRDDKLLGRAVFVETDGKVSVGFEAQGLAPGKHGFHIHETGDCDSDDFKSAGGHFAPFDSDHGGPGDRQHHVGDLGNLDVPESGVVDVWVDVPRATLDPESGASLIAGDGTALVIHAKSDDKASQPSGAAGARIACGVIQPQGPDKG